MLYLTGIIITFFLAVLLLAKKNKTFADRVLVGWLFVIAIHLLLYYFRGTLNDVRFSFLMGIELIFPLLHGPLLYLYTAAMTNQLPANIRKLWLHLILPALSFIAFCPFFSLPVEQKIAVYKKAGAGFESQIFLNLIAIFLSGIVYVAWSSILLFKHKKNIANQFSNTEKINLNWLRYLVYGIGLIWIVVVLGEDKWIFGSVTIFVMLLGFFGVGQVGVFTYQPAPTNLRDNNATQDEVPDKPLNEERELHTVAETDLKQPAFSTGDEVTVEKKRYVKSGLSAEKANLIHHELIQSMVDKKLFEESDLTLVELANLLSVHPNHLSQVINEKEGKNFYDYINSLRIEEFKRLISLPENKQFTILSLAYECGFNSKSSFNRYFKKVTNLSPSEYIQNLSS